MKVDDARIVLDLEGGPLRLLHQGQLTTLRTLDDLPGDKWMVTDFGGKATPRFMLLEAPVESAEVFVRKKIQEEGEFDEPAQILTHWKQSRSSKSCVILFTAIPLSIHHRYQELVRESADNLLLLPVAALLLRAGKAPSPSKEGSALIFSYGRFLDVLVTRHGRVVHYNHVTAYSQSAEGIASAWEMAETELDQLIRRGISFDTLQVVDWLPGEMRT